MNTVPMVSKVRSFCATLRDDGVSMATAWSDSPI